MTKTMYSSVQVVNYILTKILVLLLMGFNSSILLWIIHTHTQILTAVIERECNPTEFMNEYLHGVSL